MQYDAIFTYMVFKNVVNLFSTAYDVHYKLMKITGIYSVPCFILLSNEIVYFLSLFIHRLFHLKRLSSCQSTRNIISHFKLQLIRCQQVFATHFDFNYLRSISVTLVQSYNKIRCVRFIYKIQIMFASCNFSIKYSCTFSARVIKK